MRAPLNQETAARIAATQRGCVLCLQRGRSTAVLVNGGRGLAYALCRHCKQLPDSVWPELVIKALHAGKGVPFLAELKKEPSCLAASTVGLRSTRERW